jgi:hypothetical protein
MLCSSKDKMFFLIFLYIFISALFKIVNNSGLLTHLKIALDEIRTGMTLF